MARRSKSLFGRFVRAVRDAGANIRNKAQQSRDFFTATLDVKSGLAKADSRRQFLRYYSDGSGSATKSETRNALIKRLKDNEVTRFRTNHVGKMFTFGYFPKYHKELPYYDLTPLILLMDVTPDGFLGLNLHYLPPKARAMLLDAIVDNQLRNNRFAKEPDTVQFDYGLMKRAAKSNLYKPCVKRYLFTKVQGKAFTMIPGEDWDNVLFLPHENFQKASARKVWRDSMDIG